MNAFGNVILVVTYVTLGAWVAPDLNEELWSAAKKGDVKAVEAALAKGADVNAKTDYGATALFFAVDKGHLEVVKTLIQSAAVSGKTAMVRALLETGKFKEADFTKALSSTPPKHTEVIELLKKAGAKPTVAPKVDPLQPSFTKYIGTYRNDEGQELGVTVEEGRLALTSGGRSIAGLTLDNADSFKATEDETLTVKFEREADQISRFVLSRATSKVTYKRAEPRPEPTPKTPIVEETNVKVTTRANWPSFRGPNASGIGDGQYPPTAWNVETGSNIRWKTPIPGLGHSCPVVWGDRVYLTTAVSGNPKSEFRAGQYGNVDSVDDPTEHTWRLYCVDKNSGDIRWDQVLHRGVPKIKRHTKGSHANSTPATDGDHIVVNLGSEGLFCYTRNGEQKWKRDLGDLDSGWFFDADYQWGFGSSPIIYQDLVIVQCDVGKNSFLAGSRVGDGSEVWRTPREEIPSWGTPTVVEGPDRVELVTNATKFARGYDPLTGKEHWKLARHSEITVPTPFYAEGLIFITSGYRPVQPIYALKPGAKGDISLKEGETSNDSVLWSTTKGGPYMPTPIVYGEHLYVCSNNGVLTCHEAKTGKQIYKERLGGSSGYTASPVAADGRIYFTGEEGGVRVVKAGPKFELLAVNPLGEVCMATPAISDGMIFIRTQHHLIGVGRQSTVKDAPDATGK